MLRNLNYRTRALILLIMFSLFWWTTPPFLKKWSHVAFYEFQAPAWTALSYLRDIREYWSFHSSDKKVLIEAGIDMARLNAAYSLQNQRVDTLQMELDGLQMMFDLPPYPTFKYEIARVVRRDSSTWWQYIIIRKGITSGIEPGQAVVFSGGVVGRVLETNAYTSTVELISSPSYRTVAHFDGDGRPLEFRGDVNNGFQPATGKVMNAPADAIASLDKPIRLVSSELGGNIPRGLTLGWVYNLNPNKDGLFQSGKVRLDPRLLELREVAVLVPIEPESAAGDLK